MTTPTAGQRMQQIVQSSMLWIFVLVMTALFTLVFSFNLVLGSEVSVELDEPATEAIVAPISVTYVSDVTTQRLRDQAMAAVADVYTEPNLNALRTQLNLIQGVFNFVDVVRADAQADEPTKTRYLDAIEVLEIDEEMAATTLGFSATDWSTVKTDVLNIVEQVMRNQIQDNPSALEAARSSVATQVSINLTSDQEGLVKNLASQLIVPNSVLDVATTEELRQQVANSIEPQSVTIREGNLILSPGEVVTEEHLERLANLGLLQPQRSWRDVASVLVASLLAVSLITIYWQRFYMHAEDPGRRLVILGLLLVIFAIGAKTMLVTRTPVVYLFPAAALSMLLATIFDLRLSAFVTIIFAALLGYTHNQSLELATYAAAGPVLAVLTLRDSGRLIAFFRAGLLVAVTNMVVIILFHFFDDADAVQLLELLVMALINGVLISAGITLGGFFLIGGLFGVLTILQLQELSRLDHPLLRELLRRAPGTYHHSIMVANLAEQAAERVGAKTALVRVGAIYHDVGKIHRPPFFTENQEGVNPHDTLEPHVSARIILSHVTDGLELARKYRLPARIKDFIAQHHGNRLVYAFYMKAVENAGGDESQVDKQRFRYKGPRPNSRETGIVLLADSVEAASAALRPDTEEAIVRLVNKVVDDHLKDSQLDNSGLTMGDLERIRTSFVETLKGRFHVRVKYPGDEPDPAALEAGPQLLPRGTDGNMAQPVASGVPIANPIFPQRRET